MPGKINPTQCEALAMVCVQVLGNDVAVGIGGAGGHLQLNVYKPLLAFNLLNSIRWLAAAARSFAQSCVLGIAANTERIQGHLERSLMLATALSPTLGYETAARVARKALADGKTLREAAVELGVLSGEEFDARVRPEAMLGPYDAPDERT